MVTFTVTIMRGHPTLQKMKSSADVFHAKPGKGDKATAHHGMLCGEAIRGRAVKRYKRSFRPCPGGDHGPIRHAHLQPLAAPL